MNTDLQGNVKKCDVVSMPQKTVYRQSIDTFDIDSFVVRCEYTNGESRDFSARELEISVSGNQMRDNYKFKVPGEKSLVIKLAKFKFSYKMQVVPTFTKEVTRYEMVSEPRTLQYDVGGMFHACEFAVKCFFADGTTQTYSGDQLDITANTTPVYEGYNFVQPGKKKILVTLGDFKKSYTVTVDNVSSFTSSR